MSHVKSRRGRAHLDVKRGVPGITHRWEDSCGVKRPAVKPVAEQGLFTVFAPLRMVAGWAYGIGHRGRRHGDNSAEPALPGCPSRPS